MNGHYSDKIYENIGVNQGGNASPILFRKYLQDLITYMDRYTGININDETIIHRLWADDLFFISTNASHAQIQLNGLSKFCSPNQMLVNNIKTKFMVFGKPLHVKLKYNDTPIEEVSSYKCLGIVVNKISTFRSDMFKMHPKHLVSQARKCLFNINRKLSNIGDIPPNYKFFLYTTMAQPILTYGSELWGSNAKSCELVDKLFRWYVRWSLRVKSTTSNVITIGESGLISPSTYCHISTILYAIRLNNLPRDNILWKLFHESQRLHEMGFYSWYGKVLALADSYSIDIKICNFSDRSKFEIKSKIKRAFISKWKEDVQNVQKFPIVRTYKSFKSKFGISSYLLHVKDSNFRRALTRLRCSSHTLNIERGRYTVPITPLECRLCTVCKQIEDEKHFITECRLYESERKELFEKIIKIYPSFYSLSSGQKFNFLFKSDEPQILKWLGKFVHYSFLIREKSQ